VFADGGFASGFCRDINHFGEFAGENVIEVIGDAMEFLRADDKVHVRQFVNELPPAALGHAAHETQNHFRAVAADFGGERLHFADGFLLGGVAHAASVEQDDIGGGFRGARV